MKAEITQRIRSICFGKGKYEDKPLAIADITRLDKAYADYMENFEDNDNPEEAAASLLGSHGVMHFADHLHSAVDKSSDHPIWDGNAGHLLDYLSTLMNT